MTKSYLLKKSYQYTTDENKIILIEKDTAITQQGDRYLATVTDSNDQITICFLEKAIIENNPDYFVECPRDEIILRSLIDDIRQFFKTRNDTEDLADYAYERIMLILEKKDELIRLQAENAKLQSEIFVLKINSPSLPYTSIPTTLPWNPYQTQSRCNTCGIDLMKNTHYVCMNSACPSRTYYTYNTNITNSSNTGGDVRANDTVTTTSSLGVTEDNKS